MRNKLSVAVLVLGCFALGTLAWAAPGGASDHAFTPGLNFLFDGSQSEAAGPRGASKLSLRLYGGYNHMLAGDVNDGMAFYFDLVDFYSSQGTGTVTGGLKPLHGGYNFGGDLIYQITPALGVGVGAGYMRSSASSLATYTDGDQSVDILASAKLSAVPLRLGLFLDVPMGGNLVLTANAGAAYYLGLKFDAMQGLEFAPDDWARLNATGSGRSGADVGFHGGLGFEYRLSPKMGFFLEAAGRYAKLKNFTSAAATTQSSSGGSDTIEGVLYIITETIGTQELDMFVVSDTPPTGDTFREPRFDLSGFSLQAGIRVHF